METSLLRYKKHLHFMIKSIKTSLESAREMRSLKVYQYILSNMLVDQERVEL